MYMFRSDSIKPGAISHNLSIRPSQKSLRWSDWFRQNLRLKNFKVQKYIFKSGDFNFTDLWQTYSPCKLLHRVFKIRNFSTFCRAKSFQKYISGDDLCARRVDSFPNSGKWTCARSHPKLADFQGGLNIIVYYNWLERFLTKVTWRRRLLCSIASHCTILLFNTKIAIKDNLWCLHTTFYTADTPPRLRNPRSELARKPRGWLNIPTTGNTNFQLDVAEKSAVSLVHNLRQKKDCSSQVIWSIWVFPR